MSITSLSPLQTKPGDAPRHLRVREAITRAIRAREFAPNSRLPGERDLAENLGVSYTTVRRAIAEMVEADLLERRPNKGTFVCAHGSRRLATVTVNLIYPLNQSGFGEQFLHYSLSGLKKRGWHHHLIHLQSGREHATLRALESGEPALVMASEEGLDNRFSAALRAAGGNVVLIGNRLSESNVASIMADDAQAMRLLIGHLQGAGHRNIALVSKRPQHTVDQHQIATWKACCAAYASPKELQQRLITVEVQSEVPEAISTRDEVRRYLDSPDADATALVCLTDTSTLAAMAACLDAGRAVPAQMSIVAACNTTLLELINPPVTCVDVHVKQHVERALERIEANLENKATTEVNALIAPSLVIRKSVAPRT